MSKQRREMGIAPISNWAIKYRDDYKGFNCESSQVELSE
jgi:hypothetical protein